MHPKNSLFISSTTYAKHILSRGYCIARNDIKMCFIPKCRYHILYLGNFEELLQKPDLLCFTYQQGDSLNTLFKYQFSTNIVVKSCQVFDNVHRAVYFNQRNRGVDRLPSIAKKRLLRKKYEKHLLGSFQKPKLTHTSGLVFAYRIEQVEKTKFKVELIIFVDCLLEGQGYYTSNLASFQMNSLWTNHSLISKEISTNQLVVQMK